MTAFSQKSPFSTKRITAITTWRSADMTITYNPKNLYFSDGDKDYELWNLLTLARYATFRARENELRRYGLTPEHAQVLFMVRALGEKATPAEIARHILRAPHTVSAIVERMQRKRLVKKVKDPDRKNMVRVTLTERGLKAYELTAKRVPIHAIFNTLDIQDRVDLQRCLEKIVNNANRVLGTQRDDYFT